MKIENGVQLELNLPDKMPTLSAAVEVAAFRIMQTSLDNVVKHAQATRCQLSLAADGGVLKIDLLDDGKGIAPNYKAGVGLTSMRERAEELGGTFAITAANPRGTHLSVAIPLLTELEPTKV